VKFPCDEIIIFDWGHGHERAKTVVKKFYDRRIRLFEGLEKVPFSHSVARNTCVRLTTGDVTFYLDSDVKIKNQDSLIRAIDSLDRNTFIQGCPVKEKQQKAEDLVHDHGFLGKNLGPYYMSLIGSFVCYKQKIEESGGLNEGMYGWGHYDCEFFERLAKKLSMNRVDFPDDTLEHTNHSDVERMKNFAIKDKSETNRRNELLAAVRPWTSVCKQRLLKVRELSAEELERV
jgi:predicted glycosyltransferase involved in capsule biosynthesis